MVGRHVADDDGIGSYRHVIADRYSTQNFATHTENHVIADSGHAFSPAVGLVYNTNSAIDGAIVADDHTIRNLDSEGGMHLEAAANHSA